MSEVARIRPRGRTVAAESSPARIIEPVQCESLLNLISRVASDPTADVGKLEVLLRIQQQILDNETRREAEEARRIFNRAKSAATREMEPIARDVQNKETKSWYARLETIDAAIRPVYQRNGFDMSFDSEPLDGSNVRIICELSHDGGHFRLYSLPSPLDVVGPKGTVNKTPLHGLGSTVSYLRRYLACMIWNLVLIHEDNDGNRRHEPPTIDGELAGATQTAELYRLLRECSTSPQAEAERKLLVGVGLGGLRTLKDIPAGEFDRVRLNLIAKRDRVRQAAGGARS